MSKKWADIRKRPGARSTRLEVNYWLARFTERTPDMTPEKFRVKNICGCRAKGPICTFCSAKCEKCDELLSEHFYVMPKQLERVGEPYEICRGDTYSFVYAWIGEHTAADPCDEEFMKDIST